MKKKHHRIRKLAKYYVVQEMEGKQVLGSFSLHPKKIYELMKEKHEEKVKESTKEVMDFSKQTFGQDVLGEGLIDPTDDEAQESLSEIDEKMREIAE